MTQDSVLDLFRLDSDVPLGGCCVSVLQKVLHQGNVAIVILIDLRGIEFPEAMGTNTLIAQVIAGLLQDHLDIPHRDREDPLLPADAVPVAVVLDELLQDHRHGESALLLGFLLGDVKPVPVAVPDDVAEPK